MVSETSIPALPKPDTITDQASASDALHCTLAAVATVNRKLASPPKEVQIGAHHRELGAFHEEIMRLFKDLHELLPRIALFRADITSWSVTVGMSNTLTVNFANPYARRTTKFPNFGGKAKQLMLRERHTQRETQ